MTGSPASREVVRGRVRAPYPAGLRRARLVDQLAGPGAPRAPMLALVIAPAGCGKTTLLSHVAEAAAPAVAWLTVDQDLASVRAFLAHLRESFATVVKLVGPSWRSPGDALGALDAAVSEPTLLVLDELHTIAGAPAVEVVRLVLRHQPEHLSLALGARRLGELDIARRRLAGGVRDIGADDLRFRTWEVEELFRTCHQVRLRAGEVNLLAQRTAGWAAGLQLFQLATAGRPASLRTGLLSGGLGGGRLTGNYLAEQVLEHIPPAVRDFALRTSVLSRLSPARCDELLEADGSAELLRELERGGLLAGWGPGPEAAGISREYRYHDVLATHLVEQLETRFGTSTVRELHRRAGALWQREQAYADAVRSYSQAQDWPAVRLAIDAGGCDLAADRGAWLDLLPASIHEGDPWIALALARRALSDGAVSRALVAYDLAVTNFGGLGGTDTAVREQRAVRAWLHPPLGTVDEPLHQLRMAVVDPRRVGVPVGPAAPSRWCAHALARLVSGQLPEASAAFDTAAQQQGAPATVEALACLGQAVALTAMGNPDARDARRRASLVAATAQLPVLERLADGLVRVASGPPGAAPSDAVGDLMARCRSVDDPWGEALLALFAAVRGLAEGRTCARFARDAAVLLAALPAPALAVWASVAEAVAAGQAGTPWPAAACRRLERSAAAVGPLPHALALTTTAAAIADPQVAGRLRDAAEELARRCGAERWLARVMSLPRAVPAAGGRVDLHVPRRSDGRDQDAPQARRLQVQVLGRFLLSCDGMPVPLDGLRPQHRELLRLFCAYSDRIVRRDQLVEWFWPDADPQRAQHSLQVAVSELRRLLAPDPAGGVWTLLRRDGAGYRLTLPAAHDCDARRLEHHVGAAEVAGRNGESDAELRHLEAAVATYHGDLLPSDGCAEWAVPERDRLREVVLAAYEGLVRRRAAAGDHSAAAAAARSGLAQDRNRDGLWRQLVNSLRELQEPVAAAAAQRAYDAVKIELGVGAVPATLIHRSVTRSGRT